MIVPSTRFGDIEVAADQAIDFGPGILGFPDSPRFVLFEMPGEADYLWLQSTSEPDLAFLITRPWDFFPDYEIDVADELASEIGLEDPVDSEVFLLLTVDRADGEPVGLTANLLGPIVINTRTRMGRQFVLDNTEYRTREPLVAS